MKTTWGVRTLAFDLAGMRAYVGSVAGGSRAAVVAAVIAVLPIAPASAASVDRLQSISAGLTPNCAVSPLGLLYPESEWQPQIRANPRDPDQLAVAWTQAVHAGVMVAASDDGGVSWSSPQAVPVSMCGGGEGDIGADAWLAWGPDGTLHLIAISAPAASGPTGGPSTILSTRSSDGGRTWSAPIAVEDDGSHNDRPVMTVDPADPDRLYAMWLKTEPDGVNALYVATSTDRGTTWGEDRRLYRHPAGWLVNAPDVRVLPARARGHRPRGTVVVAFFVYTPDDGYVEERLMRSTDQGATWTEHEIALTQGHWPRDPELQHEAIGAMEIVGNAVPSLAVGPRGSLIAAWQDSDHEQGAIIVTRSTDQGLSWSEPVVVRPRGAGLAWGPTVAVDGEGVIAVTWYDGRADQPGDAQWSGEVWGAVSTDKGNTWSEVKLGGPFDLRSGPALPGAYAWGNYFGLTPVSGGFGASFAMGVPAAQTDVFFARLRP